MIVGIGNDLLDIRRIEGVLSRHGQRFIKRCFTETEIEKAESRREAGTAEAIYAKRFAAKEACSKALGTGFSDGVYMKDIGVVNDENGRPLLSLTGGALARLQTITPEGMAPRLHLSLTDEPPLAEAFVMIEVVAA